MGCVLEFVRIFIWILYNIKQYQNALNTCCVTGFFPYPLKTKTDMIMGKNRPCTPGALKNMQPSLYPARYPTAKTAFMTTKVFPKA